VRFADDFQPVLPEAPRKPPAADIVYAAVAQMHQQLISVIPGGRFLSQDGAFAYVTGVPAAMLNGVWFEHANPEAQAAVPLLDEVSRTRLPYSLRLRRGVSGGLARLAASSGMERGEDRVLKAADLTVISGVLTVNATPPLPDFAIRRLPPEQVARHAVVLAAAHAIDEDVVRRALRPDLLRPSTVCCYVGEVDGQPVTTAISVTLGAFTGIFNMATVPAAGNLGLASAVVARALADSRATGAQWCWLEADASRSRKFSGLGFHAIEQQQYWLFRLAGPRHLFIVNRPLIGIRDNSASTFPHPKGQVALCGFPASTERTGYGGPWSPWPWRP
jgi:N-acetylglutamate synthase